MKTMITIPGLRKLEEDMHNLKGREMRSALDALVEAREKGDLSENAEYEVARENLNMLNIKIISLQEKIKNCVIVHKEDVSNDSVQLFTNVKVLNTKTKKHMNFSIVTDDQIDVKQGKISQNSPIAQGLIGQTKGSNVKINVPAGVLEFKIVDITVD